MKVFNQEFIDVVCAVIFNDTPTHILVGKRNDCGLWELPGGKVEESETFVEAINREIKEELEIDFKPNAFLGTFVKDIGEKTINLYVYSGIILKGEPVANDHSELRWITKTEVDELEWIEDNDVLDAVRSIIQDS